MKMSLFELKNALKTVGDQKAKLENEIVALVANPSSDITDVQKLKAQKEDVQQRFDILKAQHDQMEKEQQAQFQAKQQTLGGIEDPKAKMTAAKAEMIRATMQGRSMSDEAKAILGDRNNTGGEKLLPKTVSDELLHEPFVKNPLRDISTFTNETNLEVPKISFQLDSDDFINDLETAKEMSATGDTVVFGRRKFKVFVPISETILKGSDSNLEEVVDQALESGLAAKEKKVALATTPKVGEEEMSFYSTQTGIKAVTATDKYLAIKAAIANLHEDYRENAKILMSFADYSDIIEKLSNSNTTLYDAPPERVLGKPVIFADGAVDPIIGDFRYSHFNYDIEMLKDRDKDVKTGVELFVLTAWFDHKIKLKSAFRIAKVAAAPKV
ncbi:prophage LambdaBa02, major capsid protein [Fictibacillus macauensis ZFHKF-1]|uniref:Prophage LambdaBa02, major capsid protein n=1 Tax=Fictibacillus macauensis ZFHKF-1 TaxID=1196324 RepID=I8AK34_9BACL|nr:phage major capsid protein [Fictibacillus macauensis]EIT85914.1 prophage LambdaBa02, major capsid protein [Fictibacillus macauensis ZFHKF-1]